MNNAVGNYTVNFTVAMPDVNYSVSGMTEVYTGEGLIGISADSSVELTTTKIRIILQTHIGATYDREMISLSIFR